MPIYNPASATSNLGVSKNGTLVGTRGNLNFIEGSNTAITAADDPGNTEVDLTISSTAAAATSAGEVFHGTISSFNEGCIAADMAIFSGNMPGTAAVWPAASRGIFVSVQLAFACTVYKLGWYNGATVGTNTVDVGIYSEAGARLISSGATLTAGASTVQSVDVADTALSADTYWLAMVMNGTTDTVFRATGPNALAVEMSSVAQMAAATPLPVTATFAAPAASFFPLVIASVSAAVL